MGMEGKLRDLRATPIVLPPKVQPLSPRRSVPVPPKSLPGPNRSAPIRFMRALDSLAMRAGRRVAGRFIGQALEIAVYALIAAAIGLPSAWYMIDTGSALTRLSDGPWRRWTAAGAINADPYTRAHFARAGWLPMNSSSARYYQATRDSNGDPLFADCDYAISGNEPAALRWTLDAYDMQGLLLEPGAGPATLSSLSALPGPGGTMAIKVSQSTSPGNWLNVTGTARMQLLLTVYGYQQLTAVAARPAEADQHIRIDKGSCR